MLEHFSTTHCAGQQKANWWNGVLEETYSGLTAAPLLPTFEAEMYRWSLGDTQLTRPRSAGCTILRENSGLPSEQKLVLHLLNEGDATLVQRNRSVRMSPGDAVICAGEEPYRFDIPERHEMLIVEFDRSQLVQHSPLIDDLVATRLAANLPGVRVLRSFLLSLWREGVHDLAADTRDGFCEALVDLVATTLRTGPVPDACTDRTLLARMKALVDSNCGNTALSPALLARELGVSLRTLQARMAEIGTTPGGYIMERRIARAAQLLIEAREMPVTSIALELGFADSSHFARQFQRRMGVSPRQYRSGH